jgi:peptidoglycan/LPS O-acetylase OafA/YrhL
LEVDSVYTASVYRKDIDGLRSLAVSAVILFHFGGIVPGGFVGVDIFFVISGFLITGLIVQEMKRGRFSFAAFYERRIRRLAPALVVVVTATFIAGWYIFLPDDFSRFARSMVATQLYFSNGLFWLEEDYFSGPSELKPLLHTWSLAVEEQFYLVIPPLLLIMFKLKGRRELQFLIVLALLSLAYCQIQMQFDVSAAFYLLPARMWELLVGSILAVAPWKMNGSQRHRELLAAAGLAAMVGSFFLLNTRTAFPGLSASFACVGTALTILTASEGTTQVSRLLSLPPFVWTGRISYSLYLWHWPIFVFVTYYILRPLERWELATLILPTFIFAAASYYYVELPFRSRGWLSRTQIFSIFAATSVCLLALGLVVWWAQGVPARFPDFSNVPTIRIEADDPGVGVCLLRKDQTYAAWSRDDCLIANGTGDPIIVWGDSHAFHLRHGIEYFAKQINRPVYFFTSSSCPPVFDVDIPSRSKCRANNSFVRTLIRETGARSIVLAANWDGAVKREGLDLDKLSATLSELRTMGVEPWVVGQVPIYALSNPDYLAYRLKAANYLLPTYSIPSRNDEKINEEVGSKIDSSHFIDAYDFFCERGRCDIVRNGQLMVVDSAHLSPAGSQLLVQSMVRQGAFRENASLPDGSR